MLKSNSVGGGGGGVGDFRKPFQDFCSHVLGLIGVDVVAAWDNEPKSLTSASSEASRLSSALIILKKSFLKVNPP